MTTYDQLWVGRDGDRLRKKKPQSALADWGEVKGPNSQAPAPGVAVAHGCKSGSRIFAS